MKCSEYDLVAYLKGELADDERDAAKSHFETCEHCARELSKIDRVVQVFHKAERVEPTPGFAWRVREAFVRAHPEFIEAARRPRGADLGWWAAFRRQFSYVPAWALSVAAHILLFAIAAILLFSPEGPEDEALTHAPLIVPKKPGVPPDWRKDWETGTKKGGTDRITGHHTDVEPKEFTDRPDEEKPGIPRRKDDRDFKRNPFDPKGWTPEEKVENRLAAFVDPRVSDREKERLRSENGGQGTAKALSAALAWLARNQREDGSWDSPGVERESFRVGVTGLALLAFLGDGHTHRRGDHKEAVDRGLRFLLSQQKMTGLVGEEDANTMYDHAIAAAALLEAHLLEKDEALRVPVAAAAMFAIKAQNENGGWGYTANSAENDTSVMGWQIVLLRLYRMVDPATPIAALNLARVRLEAATNKNDGKVGYRGRGQFPHREFAMTAVGMFAHMMARPFVDEHLVQKQEEILLAEGNPQVRTAPAAFEKNDLYYWYFGSLALYQRGGRAWSVWHQRLMKDLVSAQQADGSWPADFDKWSMYGGRAYTTAMSALILETYYRYPRFAR